MHTPTPILTYTRKVYTGFKTLDYSHGGYGLIITSRGEGLNVLGSLDDEMYIRSMCLVAEYDMI